MARPNQIKTSSVEVSLSTGKWHPIGVLSNTDIVETWFVNSRTGERYLLPIDFRAKVDLSSMSYILGNYQDYSNSCYSKATYPTLYELTESGLLIETHIYGDSVTYRGGHIATMTKPRLKAISKFFQLHGFKVTETAILHQWHSYIHDEKSGYRDEENGIHLFTPCCCNPFSISVSKLPKEMVLDWQKTYGIEDC